MTAFGLVGQAWNRCGALLQVTRTDRVLRPIFIAVLAIDLGWILWFVVTKALYYLDISAYYYKQYQHLRVTEEGGIPEMFNYTQTAVLVLLLAVLAWRNRRLIYVAFTLLFAVILLDDSLTIHETWGAFFVKRFGFREALGLRAQDYGELFAWAILGAALAPLIVAGLVRARPPHRENGLAFLVPFAVLLFCGIVVDQLFSVFGYSFFGSSILFDSVEDGGEMLAITICGALAATLLKHGPDAAPNTPERNDS